MTSPNLKSAKTIVGRLRRDPAFCPIGDYSRSGTHIVSMSDLKKWLGAAMVEIGQASYDVPEKRKGLSAITFGLIDRFLASEFTVIAVKHSAAQSRSSRTSALSFAPEAHQ